MDPDRIRGANFSRVLLVVARCLIGLSPATTWGQWEHTHKLTAYDAAAYDYFGAVSISGNAIVVGSPEDDDGGSMSGSAYVFDATTGELRYKLTAEDAQKYDRFGRVISISGNIIAIGAHGNDDAASGAGAAYVFDASTGEQLHKLIADDAEQHDFFGLSVSISGDIIVVGAEESDDAGNKSGSAYVFDATTGEQIHKLTASDATAYDYFGRSVAVSGNTIVVGADGNDDAGTVSGSAYIFDAVTGDQLHKLTADDAAKLTHFGYTVSISGNTIIVGAPWDDDACPHDPGCGSGSAYVFDATTGQQLHKLTVDDAAAEDFLSYKGLSISGNIIVIGAYGNDDACPTDPTCDSGSAYVFDAITGQQLHKITAVDHEMGDWFGRSVSISEDRIVIGAPNDDDPWPTNPECQSGSAYVYQLPPPCPADITGPDGVPDGTVDHLDLLVILGKWGTADADADIAGPDGEPDGVVDVLDLIALLGAWGPCA